MNEYSETWTQEKETLLNDIVEGAKYLMAKDDYSVYEALDLSAKLHYTVHHKGTK